MKSCFARVFGTFCDLVILVALSCAVTVEARAGDFPDAPELLSRLRDAGLPDISDADFVCFRSHTDGLRREDELRWLRTVTKAARGFNEQDKREVFVLQHRANGRSRFFDLSTLATFTVEHDSVDLKEGGRKQESEDQSMAADDLAPASLRLACQRTEDLLYSDWVQSAKGKANYWEQSFARATNAILLAAMMEQQAPSSDVAQRLVRLAAASVENPETLIAAAISRIADGQYLTLALRYRQTRNRNAFADGLEELLASRGDEWLAAGAMQILLDELQSGKALPALPPDGDFTPEQRQRAETFLRSANFDLALRRKKIPWLLTPPHYLLHRPPSDAVLRLLALRKDAISILQAWEKDDTLTAFFDHPKWSWQEEDGQNERSSLDWSHDRQDKEARDLKLRKKIYEHRLPRPQPRSHIARDLLNDILPRNVHAHNLQAKQRESYFAKLKQMSPRELAWYYLRNGHDAKAVSFLATQGEENDLQRLERGILSLKPTTSYWKTFLKAYVAARGEEARDFLEQVKSRVQDNAEGVALIERLLESIQEQKPEEQKPDAQPPPPLREAIEQYRASKTETKKKEKCQDLHRSVLLLVSMTERLEALKMLVEGARQSGDADKGCSLLFRVSLLPHLAYLRSLKETRPRTAAKDIFMSWDDFLAGKSPDIFPAFGPTARFFLANPQWDYVRALATVRELSGAWLSWLIPVKSPDRQANSTKRRIKTVVDLIIALTHHPATVEKMTEADEHLIGRLVGGNADSWRTEQVIRLLKGEIDSLSILPASDTVAAERLSEIQQAVKTLPPGKITEYLDDLRMEELMALFENRTVGNNRAISNRLRENYQRIVRTSCSIDAEPLQTLCKRFANQPASLDMIKSLGKALQAEAESKKRDLVATFDFHLRGTVLSIKDLNKPPRSPFDEYRGVMVTFKRGHAYPRRTKARAIWLKKPLSPETQPRRAVLITSKARARRDLQKKLGRFLNSSSFDGLFPFPPAQVTIEARP